MDIAITFSSRAPTSVVEKVQKILLEQVDGNITRLTTQKGPALLAHVSKRSLQSTLELATCQKAKNALQTLAGTHFRASRAGFGSARLPNSSKAPAGPVAVGEPSSAHEPAVPADDVSPAEAVLLAISCIERVKATHQLLHLLQQHGISDSSSSSSTGVDSTNTTAEPTTAVAPAIMPVTTSTAGATAAAGAAPTSASRKEEQQQQQQQQSDGQQQQQPEALIPLLQRCGLVTGVLPVHDPTAMYRLRTKSLTSFLTPVGDIREYFGDQVGFYFAFLNAMIIWLLAPAAVSMYLMWALHASSSSSISSLSSPLTPYLVVFHLIWSAVGLKLWQRQESTLDYRWHSSSSSSSSSSSGRSSSQFRSLVGSSSSSGGDAQSQPAATLTAAVGATAAEAEAATAAALGMAAAPAGPSDHRGAITVETLDDAAAAAPAAAVVGRSSVVGPHDGEVVGIGGAGLTAASLEVPAAAGVRREYTGRWRINPITRQLELLSPVPQQLLRLAVSATSTICLLLLGAAVLLCCLNLQGYIPPTHGVLFISRLAALSQIGGRFSKASGVVLSQVPLVVRSAATVCYSSYIYGPAAQLLTAFENHRTVEGFAAPLTAKQAALQLLFTFGPVTYVGLAGAGAAAARAEVAAFFKIELLRRIAMEVMLPCITVWMAAARQQQQQRRRRGPTCAGTSAGSKATDTAAVQESTDSPSAAAAAAARTAMTAAAAGVSKAAVGQAVLDLSKPKYDAFTDFWDVNRDIGYLVLFAAVYPAAAPVCLLYSWVKSKQDCLKLLVAYQRPVPVQLKGIGSWNVVLTVMVFASVITNVFLSGLTTGQLVQLLPQPVVPAAVRSAVLTAAANRPASSTEGSSFGGQDMRTAAASVEPILQATSAAGTLQQISSSAAIFGSGQTIGRSLGLTKQTSTMDAARVCLNPDAGGYWDGGLRNFGGLGYSAANAICSASDVLSGVMSRSGKDSPQMQQELRSLSGLHKTSSGGIGAAGDTVAADHLLLLFVLEHMMVIVMLLVYWCVPGEPTIVRQAANAKLLQQEQLHQQLSGQQGSNQDSGLLKKSDTKPAMVHTNPLFDKTNVPACSTAAAGLS